VAKAPHYSGAFAHLQRREFVAAVLKVGCCPDQNDLGNIVNIMERHYLEALDVIKDKQAASSEEVAMLGLTPASDSARWNRP
jgi:hypothetical protein